MVNVLNIKLFIYEFRIGMFTPINVADIIIVIAESSSSCPKHTISGATTGHRNVTCW